MPLWTILDVTPQRRGTDGYPKLNDWESLRRFRKCAGIPAHLRAKIGHA